MSAHFPVFIGGINRSGTSLTRQLLGSHPELAIPPTEFEFVRQIPRRELTEPLGPERLLELTAQVLQRPKIRDWNLDPADVARRLDTHAGSARDLFVAVMDSFAATAGKSRWGEKTTEYERYLGVLDRWFPKFAFVHVIRHPVNTYASARWYGGIERSVDPASWSLAWQLSALTALKERRRRGPHYVVVRYEDLVRRPEVELKKLCAALELDYTSRLLTVGDLAEPVMSSFFATDGVVNDSIRAVDTVRRSERVAPEELRVLRAHCRRVAALAGYDVDADEPVAELGTARHGALLRSRLLATQMRAPSRLGGFLGA